MEVPPLLPVDLGIRTIPEPFSSHRFNIYNETSPDCPRCNKHAVSVHTMTVHRGTMSLGHTISGADSARATVQPGLAA